MTAEIPQDLPAYLPLDEVAEAAGISRDRYHRHLRNIGALHRVNRDAEVITDVLRNKEPYVYAKVMRVRIERELFDGS